MNIVVKSALSSVALAFVYACATPVEIEDDVRIASPSDFGDAGALGGAGGQMGQSGASPGGTGQGIGGTGSGAGGAGISGMPVGSSGSSGLPRAGAGGGGVGVGGSAGSGGAAGAAATAAGAGGVPGLGGSTGSAGLAGTGGTGSGAVFDAASCDFADTTGCDALACQTRCPPNGGDYCPTSCVAVVDCVDEQVAQNPAASCVTAEDPLCGRRVGAQTSPCTMLVESAGGVAATAVNQPAFVAREYVQCICSVPRP